MPRPIAQLIAVITLFAGSSDLFADESGDAPSSWKIERWTVLASVYTRHFDPEPDHVNDQNLLGVEAEFSNRWILGVAVFDNSYGQSSQFLYVAKRWQIKNSEHWYARLRGGLIHGYEEPFDNKIPFNGLGVAPVIIPSLGFQYRHFISEFSIAGTAAGMLTVGFQF